MECPKWQDSYQGGSQTQPTWPPHIWDMIHPYTWHDSFIHLETPERCGSTLHVYMTLLIRIRDMTNSYAWQTYLYTSHDSFIHVTWLIHSRDMTHSYIWHDSFVNVTWLVLDSNTRLLVEQSSWKKKNDSSKFLKWLIHIRLMSHSYTWHKSFLAAPLAAH